MKTIKKFLPGKQTTFCIVTAVTLSFSSAILADTKALQLNIQRQALGSALMELGERAGVEVIIPQGIDINAQLSGINGAYTLAAALDELLKGQALSYQFTSDSTVVITNDVPNGVPAERGKVRKESDMIEEMIVTATKRESNLQDTAMAISALSGDLIEKRGLTGMSDYLNTLPGVTMQDRGTLGNAIVIRGIAVDPEKEIEAVATYFGETPTTGLGTRESGGAGHADFKLVDIERVEVLRGPQGSLYGAGSMGGTVRILPARPNLNDLEVKLGAELSKTGEQGGNNTKTEAVVNLPLIQDKLGLRAVLYQLDNSGYIENVAASYDGPGNVKDPVSIWGGSVSDSKDEASEDTTGVRLSARWEPIDPLSINLSYARQETESNGFPEVETYLPGPFQQVRATPGDAAVPTLDGHALSGREGANIDTRITSLTLNYKVDWGSLQSTTSLLRQESWLDKDATRYLSFVGNYWSGTSLDIDNFIQEVRFVSDFGGPIEFVAGLYHEDKSRERYNTEGFAGDPDKTDDLILGLGWPIPEDAPAGFTYDGWQEFSFQFATDESLKQQAFFGEVTMSLTDQVSATLGMRSYEYEQSMLRRVTGVGALRLTPKIDADLDGENSGETYKANLSWKPNDDMHVYFQWSEGFRPGIALSPFVQAWYDPDNSGFYTTSNGTKIPIRQETDPDTLENFELGFKATFLDKRITLNGAIYRINWEGLPVAVRLFNFNVNQVLGGTTINAGKSLSEGVEIELQALIADNLHFGLSTSYNETRLANDQEGLGKKGDDLPGSADFNFATSLEYSFTLSGYDAFARFDYSYVGEYDSFIDQSDAIPSSGGYEQLHLKGGITIGHFDIDLFVKNLTNADDITWVSPNSRPNARSGFRLRPRTMGMSVRYTF